MSIRKHFSLDPDLWARIEHEASLELMTPRNYMTMVMLANVRSREADRGGAKPVAPGAKPGKWSNGRLTKVMAHRVKLSNNMWATSGLRYTDGVYADAKCDPNPDYIPGDGSLRWKWTEGQFEPTLNTMSGTNENGDYEIPIPPAFISNK